MYSNLTKTNYEIQDLKLQDLRDRLIQENNLTPLDILKGFHAKSKINLTYTCGLTEENLKDVETLAKEYARYFSDEITNNVQARYDAEFNALFDECKKHFPEVTIDDVLNYKANNKECGLDVPAKNAIWEFLRRLKDVERKLKNQIKEDALNHINQYAKENFTEHYKVFNNGHTCFGKVEGLPYQLEVNTTPDIDFTNVYKICKDQSGSLSEWIVLEYDSHVEGITKLKFYEYDTIGAFVLLPEQEAKKVFEDAVNSMIYKNNRYGELEYLQNLEAQPITINVNTKTGKYELIDGYKRLLYVTDKDLLKFTAPVKIFTDLDDTQFLTLLYAANVWKTKDEFHDRGFLFALKTRFGFIIPESAYEGSFADELNTLKLYDFGENLVHADKSKIMNTLHCHKHLANDIKLLYNFMPQEAKNHKFDKNILDEIMFAITELVGEVRRVHDGKGNELTEDIIKSIFADSTINSLCSKKHLSTRTYVLNYFRNKGIYKVIFGILKESLIIDYIERNNTKSSEGYGR